MKLTTLLTKRLRNTRNLKKQSKSRRLRLIRWNLMSPSPWKTLISYLKKMTGNLEEIEEDTIGNSENMKTTKKNGKVEEDTIDEMREETEEKRELIERLERKLIERKSQESMKRDLK